MIKNFYFQFLKVRKNWAFCSWSVSLVNGNVCVWIKKKKKAPFELSDRWKNKCFSEMDVVHCSFKSKSRLCVSFGLSESVYFNEDSTHFRHLMIILMSPFLFLALRILIYCFIFVFHFVCFALFYFMVYFSFLFSFLLPQSREKMSSENMLRAQRSMINKFDVKEYSKSGFEWRDLSIWLCFSFWSWLNVQCFCWLHILGNPMIDRSVWFNLVFLQWTDEGGSFTNTLIFYFILGWAFCLEDLISECILQEHCTRHLWSFSKPRSPWANFFCTFQKSEEGEKVEE